MVLVIDEPGQAKTAATAPVKPAVDTQSKTAPAQARELTIYLDGKFVPEADAKVSVFDHGLLYGDGIFEGIRFYNGRVFRLEEHLERLWDSARSICLDIPIDRGEMTEALLETVRQERSARRLHSPHRHARASAIWV